MFAVINKKKVFFLFSLKKSIISGMTRFFWFFFLNGNRIVLSITFDLVPETTLKPNSKIKFFLIFTYSVSVLDEKFVFEDKFVGVD